jgi:magnesium transporter
VVFAVLILHKPDQIGTASGPALGAGIVWCDLYNPTREEELRLEAELGVSLPTREDMQEIEASSRLYLEDGAAIMTAVIVLSDGQTRPRSEPVTFVLVKNRLVTVRYVDPPSFGVLCSHAGRDPGLMATGQAAFLGLLDVIVDRTADLIEKTEDRIDAVSRGIFRTQRETRLEAALIEIGDVQNTIARIRDSLVSLARLTTYAHNLDAEVVGLRDGDLIDFRNRLRTLGQDVASLSDHASYITGNMSFLLDAALGLISVEQNNVMKLISVVSVIFLPLTLIASIYGMNFDGIPFLHAKGAFYGCIGLMAATAAGLIWWLRSRRWL